MSSEFIRRLLQKMSRLTCCWLMRIRLRWAEDMKEESCVHDIRDPDAVDDPTEPTAEDRAEPPLQRREGNEMRIYQNVE